VIDTRPAVINREESIKLHALPRRRVKTKLAISIVAVALVPAALLISESSQAVEPISLGIADSFSVFAQGALTNTGTTKIFGDMGALGAVDLGAIGELEGLLLSDENPSNRSSVLSDITSAYNSIVDLPQNPEPISTPITNLKLSPGVHSIGAALTIDGPLVLDATGNPDGVFIFQVNGVLNINSTGSVTIIGGGSAENVYWQVNGAVNLFENSEFAGTVLAWGAITAFQGASVQGRIFAVMGAIVLATNDIRRELSAAELATIAAEDADDTPADADAADAVIAAEDAEDAEDAEAAADAVIATQAAAAQAELDALAQEKDDAGVTPNQVVADRVADDADNVVAVNVVADRVADDAVNAVSSAVSAVSSVVSAAVSAAMSAMSAAMSAINVAANSALKSISAISSALK
jgi:hypothetical protein